MKLGTYYDPDDLEDLEKKRADEYYHQTTDEEYYYDMLYRREHQTLDASIKKIK